MIRSLSVVVPTYDEADVIGTSLDRIERFLATLGVHSEIVVSDDGSRDGTVDRIQTRFGSRVRVLRGAHAGKGAAVRAGVMAAGSEWVLVCDADLSIPIEEFHALARHADRAPIVIGSKHVPGRRTAYPLGRRIAARIGSVLVAWLVVPGFHDTQCGFKLLRRDVAQALFTAQRLDGFGYDFEILCLARRWRLPVVETPVACEHRDHGSVGFTAYLRTLGEALKVAWRRLSGAYPASPPGVLSEANA